MGLDQHLEGRTFNWQSRGERPKKDGFPVKGVTLELGYWRKHPDLHGYIVQNYAGGRDECQEIELDDDALRDIINAVKNKRLPHTEGFFFGASDGSEDEETIEILEKALAWLENEKPPRRREPKPIGGGLMVEVVKPEDFAGADESRTVIYKASW